MKKKLVKMGNSLGVIIPLNLLELMGVEVNKNTEIELNFDGKAVIITAVTKDKEIN